ncbi:hypothetical protein PG984_009248 [Apiospora sp. TS-2023a]
MAHTATTVTCVVPPDDAIPGLIRHPMAPPPSQQVQVSSTPGSVQPYYHGPPIPGTPDYFLWTNASLHPQSHYRAQKANYTVPNAGPVVLYYPAWQPAPMPSPPTVAPLRMKEWNLQSKVSYEVLRKIGHPVYLSQCIAGTYSGIRSPTGFNKAVWNEAVQMLREAYPGWMDEKKLEEFYLCERNFREANERIRDDKAREKRMREKTRDKTMADLAEFNAETRRLLAELDAKKREAQDAHTASPAGPSDSEAPSPEIDQADEVEAAEPQAEAVEAPEEPTEEKSTDSSHEGPKTTSQGPQTDELDESRPGKQPYIWAVPRPRPGKKY